MTLPFSSRPIAGGPSAEPETIYAMLLESLDDEYEVAVARGALAGARQQDARLLCVAGGALSDPEPERAALNFVFDLIDARNAKGVIALTSAIGNYVGPAGLKLWLERFAEVPVCSLGVMVEGHPHVGVDNYGGMFAVVTHLVEVHAARRVAFVCGPADSPEAHERRKAYADALERAGIEVAERLIVEHGDYTKAAGVSAVKQLFDERGVTPGGLDAIVGANDYMALGAISELLHRHLRVPEDILVAGFDDVESARLARPALTTASQPGNQLGREGIEVLHALLGAGSAPTTKVLPTRFLVRRSCGCDAVDVGWSTRSSIPTGGHSLEASLVQRRQVILAELMRAGRGAFGAAGRGWEERMLDALIDELQGRRTRSLATTVEQHLLRLEPEDVNGVVIQDVLSALRRQSLPCVTSDIALRDGLEASIHDARIVAAQAVSEVVEARMRRSFELLDKFELCAHRALFEDQVLLGVALEKPLTALGVEACVLAGLERPGDVHGDATVLLAFGAGRPRSGELTKLWALPLHPALQRMARALLMLPLTIDTKPAGVALIAVSNIDGALVEHLRMWFTTMLRVARLKGDGALAS